MMRNQWINEKKKTIRRGQAGLVLLCLLTLLSGILAGCGTKKEAGSDQAAAKEAGSDQVATKEEMADVNDVVEEGMTPVKGTDLKDGVYPVTVDSSSSMFQITACTLTVSDGTMTAEMTMGGKGYRYLFMGTGEEAVKAEESQYILFAENDEGAHTFVVPVEALDQGIPCAAFSKKKEKWYDRTLVFRADSLPAEAYREGVIVTCSSLELEDGTYQVDVKLTGGSGKASVSSPALLEVKNGQATATIEWSSKNYDYMKVEDEKYLPINTEGNAVFRIPVIGFDYEMPVIADTTAMSEPHEISYTLYFDSASIVKK